MIKTSLEKIYTVSERYPKYKKILTPIIGSSFALITVFAVVIPVNIENNLIVHPDLDPLPRYILALPLIFFGAVLMIWTTLIFLKTKGTPVPVNPPPHLVVKGPYKYIRNPMHGGMFLIMIGFGIYYSSILSVLVFTPLYIYLDIMIFKKIEEPELVNRLGEAYLEYRKNTPMLFPKIAKTVKVSD